MPFCHGIAGHPAIVTNHSGHVSPSSGSILHSKEEKGKKEEEEKEMVFHRSTKEGNKREGI